MENFVDLYNPANAKNLTKEQNEALRNLTIEEIKELAKAYPNKPGGESAYLVLMDKTKKDKDQVFPLSTWQNLNSLFRQGNKNFVAVGFRATFNRKAPALKVAPLQDMTNDQAKAELKTASPQTAKSTPVNKNPLKVAAEQEAKKEGEEIEKEKPLEKMNKEELAAKYEQLYDDAPDIKLTKKELIDQINESLAKGEAEE